MTMQPFTIVHCRFHIRSDAGGGKFRYKPVTLGSRASDGRLPTPHPPAAGDLISLYDPHVQEGGLFRVIDRHWQHASYGSAYWPAENVYSGKGPLLDVMVEPAGGMFVNQAPPEEEGDEPV